jgi:Tfp pilus assembly protein FimV
VETMTTLLPRVRVLSLHSVDDANVLISADLEIGNSLVLRKVTVFLDPQTGTPCVRPPQLRWEDTSSERHYYAPCRFHKPLRKHILAALLAHYNKTGVQANG